MVAHSPAAFWLRCTAFEELMLAQDSPEYPCAICLRLEFSQALPIDDVRRACHEVVRRHPLLRARLVRRWLKLWWCIQREQPPIIISHDTPAPDWPEVARINLAAGSGVVVDVYAGPPGSDVGCVMFLQVHHALADGLGCLAMVEDLTKVLGTIRRFPVAGRAGVETIPTALNAGASSYTDALNAGASSYEEGLNAGAFTYGEELLRRRNRFGLDLVKVLRLIPGQLIGLAGVRQFLMRQPVPIENTQAARQVHVIAQPETIHACSLELESVVSERLKELARSQQCTLNDVLACAVFEAVYQLHCENGGQRDQWLRMMVPMSLRDPEADRQLPACNVVSCVFLDRTGRQIVNHDSLLASIHQEMALIKRHRLAFIFIFSLWIKKILTLHIRFRDGYLNQPVGRCHTSVVFSNMARILHCQASHSQDGRLTMNELCLLRCQILAPVAPLMSVAITAVQYAGRVTLALRYDWRRVTDQQAQRLLSNLQARLETRLVAGAAK